MGTKEFEKTKRYIFRIHSYDVTPNNFVDWVLQLNFSLIEHSIKLINETGKFDIIHAHDWIVAFAARVLNILILYIISTIHATEYGELGYMMIPEDI